jgi:uncharacterized protein with HEPN domain
MSLSQVEFLRHILDECNYLLKESAQSTFDEFLANDRLTRAVCRSLEIIGEASNKIEDLSHFITGHLIILHHFYLSANNAFAVLQ